MLRTALCILMIIPPLGALAQTDLSAPEQVSPESRDSEIPHTRWEGRPESALWTRSALSALKGHGVPLVTTVPRDIDSWCPAYRTAGDALRRAFWVGFLSALSKHESTYRPDAVGGGGKWFGLLQILPATARGYGCEAQSGTALKDGSANLSCAIRILSVTVPRDQAIAINDGKWRGVAADWGPLTSNRKRGDMSQWLRKQKYCQVAAAVRPKPRPGVVTQSRD